MFLFLSTSLAMEAVLTSNSVRGFKKGYRQKVI